MDLPGFRRTAGQGRRARSLAILRYEPGESFLHRLDPRTRMLALLLVSMAALFFSSLAAMVVLLGAILALALVSRLGGNLGRAYLLISPFLAIILILDSLFPKVSGGPVWFAVQAWFLHAEVTPDGILFALTMGLRLLAIAGFSFLFIMTTSHDDFIRSLRSIRIPATLSFSLGYALRSTTSLAGDVRNIMDAQRSRGMDFGEGGLTRNRTNLMAVFTPVTVSLLKRSQHVTDAMQSRGFSRTAQKTCYRPCRFGMADGMMAVSLAGLVLFLFLVEQAAH
jgi:energy-coupling factor transport system permease protein